MDRSSAAFRAQAGIFVKGTHEDRQHAVAEGVAELWMAWEMSRPHAYRLTNSRWCTCSLRVIPANARASFHLGRWLDGSAPPRLPCCPNPCLLPRRSACQPLSAGMPAMSAAPSPRLPGNGRPRACCVLDRRHMIYIALRAARGYHVVLYRSTRLRRREDGPDATSGFDSTRPSGTGP